MRLSRETLLKIARDTAAQRARISRRIICIYLTGSILREDSMLGGTTDIDLIFVHDSEPIQPREIVRLSDEVHLDIGHYDQDVFHQPRHLRTDPWLGSFIYNKPVVLYDTHHWFEFTQASTGAQFFDPDYTLMRANSLAQAARQGWLNLTMGGADHHNANVQTYLHAVRDAGNAIACLSGLPITERRFFLNFPQRAQAVNRPELASRLISLISDPSNPMDAYWGQWLSAWKETYLAASKHENHPASLEGARMLYYERAAEALWQENPIASLWILMSTWARCAAFLLPDSPLLEPWSQMLRIIQLDEESFPTRLEALDQSLDLVDETIETWGKENGASPAV